MSEQLVLVVYNDGSQVGAKLMAKSEAIAALSSGGSLAGYTQLNLQNQDDAVNITLAGKSVLVHGGLVLTLAPGELAG